MNPDNASLYLPPEAARPWISEEFRSIVEKHKNSMLNLAGAKDCHPYSARLTQTDNSLPFPDVNFESAKNCGSLIGVPLSMHMNYKTLTTSTLLLLHVCIAHASGKREEESDVYTYPTKFGKIEFVDEHGKRASLASKILLNGSQLTSTTGVVNRYGSPQSYMVDSFANPIDLAPRKPGQTGPVIVNRMILSIGTDGNCIRRYIVLDFTGPKPFVSKPFAYNPDDDICEHLKRVRWGKKETAIDLAGPQRYLYRSYRDVIGPIDD